MKFFEEIRQSKIIQTVNRFINSKYMLAVLAGLILLSNVFALELWVYALVGVLSLYLCLFGKDMLVLAPLVIFLYISPSVGNNPFLNPNSIFFHPGVLCFFAVVVVLFIILFLIRIATDYGFLNFLKYKRQLLLGFLLLGAAFFLGGLGYKEYDWANLKYNLILFMAFFTFYFILTAAVRWEETPKDYFAWMGLFIGVTVVIQLINVYLTNDIIQPDGYILRGNIYTGWGSYPSMSNIIVMCIPCVFYLAVKHKQGFVFSFLGCIFYLSIIASNCRGSILVGGLIFVVCVILTLCFKQNRKQNLIVYGAIFALLVIIYLLYSKEISTLFIQILQKGLDDSGRINLYIEAMQRFFNSPIFGQGFFAASIDRWNNPGGVTLMPYFWHNTLIQMLAACGVIGLAAYLFHRYQTILLFFQKPTVAKLFISLSILGMVVVCLIDCHIFNVGGTLAYSVFLTFLEKVEECKEEQ